MSLQESIDKLNELDLSEIDFSDIAYLSTGGKVILLVVLFTIVLVGGWFGWVNPKYDILSKQQAAEVKLKRTFEKKSHQAANIDEYTAQNEELKRRFEGLLAQLPTDTEVPGLLEDVTTIGVSGGLDIESIDLGDETAKEYFVELPMTIRVLGSYHDFGAFVSGIAGLSRIVTLHDFDLSRKGGDDELSMTVQAKTYRYREDSGL